MRDMTCFNLINSIGMRDMTFFNLIIMIDMRDMTVLFNESK